jgi:glutamate synthase domain-containing protein 2
VNPHFLWPLLILAPASVVGVVDLIQPSHTLLRNYPLVGHLRWMFEGIRPEIRQYLFESDLDARPFSREQRTLVYARSKNEEDHSAFGTKADLRAADSVWLNHSIRPSGNAERKPRMTVGGRDCRAPYDASIFNISGMSYGALGAHAVLALNKGAKMGGFAHNTGEGGVSRYHLEHGGDLVWQIGTGYFGCRRRDGGFDPDRFAVQASAAAIKLIEIKISQGAKPGHGGVLPAGKITAAIAEARGVAQGEDCLSPPGHSAFATPVEMMEFIARLRELSGGKPVGFKLCVGHPWEVMALCKAMIETGIAPDFITVDGAEGGTGAAPVEFADSVGTPLREGLNLVDNCLRGAGLRERIRLIAAGKIVSAFDIAVTVALGADLCNSARGFLFSLGCVQSRRCHTNRCPTGITTHDPARMRGLVIEDKALRVATYHRKTLDALHDILTAAGVVRPADLDPCQFLFRRKDGEILVGHQMYPRMADGELIDGGGEGAMFDYWRRARADSFTPVSTPT